MQTNSNKCLSLSFLRLFKRSCRHGCTPERRQTGERVQTPLICFTHFFPPSHRHTTDDAHWYFQLICNVKNDDKYTHCVFTPCLCRSPLPSSIPLFSPEGYRLISDQRVDQSISAASVVIKDSPVRPSITNLGLFLNYFCTRFPKLLSNVKVFYSCIFLPAH